MLDQSFSAENFRKILDFENRKGTYLEGKFFPTVDNINQQIKSNKIFLKENKGRLSEEDFQNISSTIEDLNSQRESELINQLKTVSRNIVDSPLNFGLRKLHISSKKPIYVLNKTPESFFSLKQAQNNIAKLYKVKQANRISIVNQLKILLDNDFPKFVIRTDIESFYESIPHKLLLNKIQEDSLLTYFSKKIVRHILREYEQQTGKAFGVPRGVGISAYLAELFMRDLDKDIKALPFVTYYARYVDDIVIIITPDSIHDTTDFIGTVKGIVESAKYGLKLNAKKTKPFDLRRPTGIQELNFLGYKIFFSERDSKKRILPIRLDLSQNKINKYKERIKLTLEAYLEENKINSIKARRNLLNRINYLTNNTRLHNNKSNILIGIYFSHSLLTERITLSHLDRSLQYQVARFIGDYKLKTRLRLFSFLSGFENRKFAPFTPTELKEITKAWENV